MKNARAEDTYAARRSQGQRFSLLVSLSSDARRAVESLHSLPLHFKRLNVEYNYYNYTTLSMYSQSHIHTVLLVIAIDAHIL